MRRGGWIGQATVSGDTDAVSRGLNVRLMARCLSDFIDPELREILNAHCLENPSYTFTRYGSQANFQIGTADNLMVGDIQDISFTEQASPANNHQVTGLTFAKVVQHILQKHCNFVYDATGAAGSPDGILTQFSIDTTNSTPIEIFNVSKSDNMWRTLQSIGGGEEGGGEFYRCWFNKFNKFFYQPAPPFMSPQPSAKGTLTKSHIRGTVQVRLNNAQPGQKIGQVQLAAVKNSTTVYDAAYPTNPTDGKVLRMVNGVWANSQARADTLAQRLYKWKTRQYALMVEVDPGLILFGDDGKGLDLGDRLLATYNGPAEDADTGAGVHLNLSAQSLFVYGADVRFDAAGRTAKATLILEHDNSA